MCQKPEELCFFDCKRLQQVRGRPIVGANARPCKTRKDLLSFS